MNFVTLKIKEASDHFQGRCFKTKIDLFNWLPMAFIKQGLLLFLSIVMRFGGWCWVVLCGSLTTVKQLAENMCSFLYRQNHIMDRG